jgi:RNA polymerase sigma factor (sigma-70 family)
VGNAGAIVGPKTMRGERVGHIGDVSQHLPLGHVERRDALIAALEAHQRKVFNYFRRMGMPREPARDCSQETFLRAIRGASRFRGDAPPEVWLLGIARNVFREWLRSDRHLVEEAPDVMMVGPDEERVDVQRALSRLDSDHREVLVLRFVLDLPGEEVARILHVSHDAVRQRVARAKREFRRIWDAS